MSENKHIFSDEHAVKTQDDVSESGRHTWGIARRIVQIAVLVFFLIPVMVSGWSLLGVDLSGDAIVDAVTTPAQFFWTGTLSSSTIGFVDLMDPFAMLQTIAASKAFDVTWLLAALPPLVVFALVRGRVFCGWVCPVNLLLEVIDTARQKLWPNKKLPEHRFSRHVKVWIALVILILSALVSVPVYEIFNPISFINKGLLFGGVAGGVTFIAIVVIELFWGHRVWCRSLCPLGGFYELLGKVGLVKVSINHDACIKCGHCKQVCLADPEILVPAVDDASNKVCAGDCMMCGKCIDVCPTQALAARIAFPDSEQLRPVRIKAEK